MHLYIFTSKKTLASNSWMVSQLCSLCKVRVRVICVSTETPSLLYWEKHTCIYFDTMLSTLSANFVYFGKWGSFLFGMYPTETRVGMSLAKCTAHLAHYHSFFLCISQGVEKEMRSTNSSPSPSIMWICLITALSQNNSDGIFRICEFQNKHSVQKHSTRCAFLIPTVWQCPVSKLTVQNSPQPISVIMTVPK